MTLNDQCCTLFLTDLSAFCSDQDIRMAFSPFGEIAELSIMRSNKTGLGLGYGFVRYFSTIEASNALKAMENVLIRGRKLKIWSTKDTLDTDQTMTTGSSIGSMKEEASSKIEALVHCKFNSVERINFMIDESYLEELFSTTNGEVVCVSIKQHRKND
eukprot:gene6881-9427_t